MATCRECSRPTPLEELASEERCTACCQRAYGLTGIDADWDAEAERLFARLHIAADAAGGRRHNDLDAVWQDETTGAHVYVGNRRAASSRKILAAHGISAVVNCQGADAANFFESGGVIRYLRFDVQRRSDVVREDGNEAGDGVVDYFAPCFGWIDAELAAGKSVLIHCYAGAHRAGTVCVAFLMHAAGLGLADAMRMARRCRPIVNPFARLLKLLHMLDRALVAERAGDETPRGDARSHTPGYIRRVSEVQLGSPTPSNRGSAASGGTPSPPAPRASVACASSTDVSASSASSASSITQPARGGLPPTPDSDREHERAAADARADVPAHTAQSARRPPSAASSARASALARALDSSLVSFDLAAVDHSGSGARPAAAAVGRAPRALLPAAHAPPAHGAAGGAARAPAGGSPAVTGSRR